MRFYGKVLTSALQERRSCGGPPGLAGILELVRSRMPANVALGAAMPDA